MNSVIPLSRYYYWFFNSGTVHIVYQQTNTDNTTIKSLKIQKRLSKNETVQKS